MELVQDFLQKYRLLTPPQASKTKLIVQVIKDECGVLLEHTDVTVRRGGATLSCHPTVRSEVLRCAPRVLETLYREHKLRLSFLR